MDNDKGRSVSNSDLRDSGFDDADGTPVFAPTAKPINLRNQTKEVLKHLQEVKRQKKRGSPLNNPAFLGAAMKAIYESSEVSVKRGDQTMVVTQLKGDKSAAITETARDAPTAKDKPPQVRQSAPPSTSPYKFNRPDPFSAARPPVDPVQPALKPEWQHQKTNGKGAIDDLSLRSSSSYSITDILFWVSLVLVFLSLAFWISP